MMGRDVRDQVIEPGFFKHEMHVAWPPAVSAQFLQQLANRPVVGDGIGYGHDALEPKYAVLVAFYDSTSVCFISPVFILHIVFALAVCFPHIDFDVGYGVAGCGLDGAKDEERCTSGVGRDGAAIGVCGRVMGVEGPEDCAFGAGGWFWVIDRVNEERETDYVGEEDEFL